jgi:hypothetical protein
MVSHSWSWKTTEILDSSRAECAARFPHDLTGRGGPRCVAHRRGAGGALATRGGGAHVGPRTTRRSNMMLAGGCWPLWFSCSAGRGAGVCLRGPAGCCCLLGDRVWKGVCAGVHQGVHGGALVARTQQSVGGILFCKEAQQQPVRARDARQQRHEDIVLVW